MKKASIATLITLIILISRVDAYDMSNMHPLINEKASLASSNFLSILHSLGYKETPPNDILYSNVIAGQNMKYWIRMGGTEEDDGIRWAHHFHDPTQTWDVAGLGGAADRYSSLLWAQNKQANNTLMTNEWSWAAARTYYYQALTKLTTTLREKNLSDSLRSLGQVMHLLADAAVPEHARDDLHPFDNIEIIYPAGSRYETRARDNAALLVESSGTPVNPSITNTSLVLNLNPISNFWDTTPVAGYGENLLGLAEYTNHNFLSPDTIFTKYTYPVNPQSTGYVQYVYDIDMASFDERVYFSGSTSDGKPIEHLVSAGYFWSDLGSDMYSAKYQLDENCFYDYAQILVPKAVDYDTALLDYFFRGTLEITLPDTGVYSIADGSQTPFTANGNEHQMFTKLKAMVMNTTPNEAIGAGTLTAVARYKIIPNYASDLSNYPPNGLVMSGDGTPSNPGVPYSYSVSLPETVIEGDFTPGYYTEFPFNFTEHPIPAGITDLTLQVVFKGTIGNETENAIAVGMKDLMEPTHLTFWNLTDMVSLPYPGPEYSLYTFDVLKSMATPNSSLLSKLDKTPNGSLDDEAYLKTRTSSMTISFWTGWEWSIAVTLNVPAARHIRLIALVDQPTENYVELKWEDLVDPGSLVAEFNGVVNQAGQNGAFAPTPVQNFRRQGYAADGQPVPFIQHFYAGYVVCEALEGSSLCIYPDEQAVTVENVIPLQFSSPFFD